MALGFSRQLLAIIAPCRVNAAFLLVISVAASKHAQIFLRANFDLLGTLLEL